MQHGMPTLDMLPVHHRAKSQFRVSKLPPIVTLICMFWVWLGAGIHMKLEYIYSGNMPMINQNSFALPELISSLGGTFSSDVSCCLAASRCALSDVRPGSVFISGLFSLRVGIQIFQIPFLSICTLNLPPCKLQLLELTHTHTRVARNPPPASLISWSSGRASTRTDRVPKSHLVTMTRRMLHLSEFIGANQLLDACFLVSMSGQASFGHGDEMTVPLWV